MTGAGGLFYDRYQTNGSDEWLMRIGAGDKPPILFVSPLFEEMNRTRAFTAHIMRTLAAGGHGCWLADLPGTGESERALADCAWQDWRDTVRDAANFVAHRSEKAPLIASLRGGALIDDAAEAPAYWRFAPAEGSSLARDLTRSSLVKAGAADAASVDLAGYTMSEALFRDFEAAAAKSVTPLRTLRLDSDKGEADRKVAGPALWRRSEPGTSPELAELLAADIADWARTCADS